MLVSFANKLSENLVCIVAGGYRIYLTQGSRPFCSSFYQAGPKNSRLEGKEQQKQLGANALCADKQTWKVWVRCWWHLDPLRLCKNENVASNDSFFVRET